MRRPDQGVEGCGLNFCLYQQVSYPLQLKYLSFHKSNSTGNHPVPTSLFILSAPIASIFEVSCKEHSKSSLSMKLLLFLFRNLAQKQQSCQMKFAIVVRRHGNHDNQFILLLFTNGNWIFKLLLVLICTESQHLLTVKWRTDRHFSLGLCSIQQTPLCHFWSQLHILLGGQSL